MTNFKTRIKKLEELTKKNEVINTTVEFVLADPNDEDTNNGKYIRKD